MYSESVVVIDKYFDAVFDYINSRKKTVLLSLLGLLLACTVALPFVKMDSNIRLMIPKGQKISRDLDFFTKSKISDMVLISVGISSTDGGKNELIKAIDDIASSLDSKYFSEVATGISSTKGNEIVDKLLNTLPMLITEKELALVESNINREYVSKRLGKIYRQLLKPGGIFFSTMARSDPLGLKYILLKKLKRFSSAGKYDMDMDDEHFISKDGRHGMILARSSVRITDTHGVKAMVGSLTKSFETVPENISIDIVSGHFHTFSNEKVIKSDIQITMIVAAVGFFILILVVFKDIRSLLIYIIPMVSVIIGIQVSYLLMGGVSYVIIGLGAVIAGISLDYGIHVYVAAMSDSSGFRNVKLVAKPVIISALTTVGVFFTFFFSHVEGYYQLAIFSIVTILISLIIATLILPQFVGGRGDESRHKFYSQTMEQVKVSKLALGVWAIFTSLFLYFSFQITFDTDMSKMDGTEKSILASEKRFHDTWGTKKMAIVVSNGKTYKDALKVNEAIQAEVEAVLGKENYLSIAGLWPSLATRQKNLARWTEFWKNGKEKKLRQYLSEEGQKYGFSDDAFKPFFDNLYLDMKSIKVSEDESSIGIGNRFAYKTDSGFQIISFFPDKPEYLNAVGKITDAHPSAFVVSSTVINRLISDITISDMKILTTIAVALIFLLTLLLLRDVREVILSLLPVVTSTIWVLGALHILGYSLNMATLVPYLVVMGLTVDYGIFMTYRSSAKLKTGTVLAVTISAASTLMGAAVLLFASHPVLLSTGVTMMVGITSGYLSSIFVIPYFFELMKGKPANV